MKRYNIAVVEDSELWRYLIRHELDKYHNFKIVLNCEWGDDFFSEYPLLHIDLILLDISLPGMSAIELARRVKLELPKIPLVIFTSSNNTRDIEYFNMLGIDGYIYKSRILDLNKILCNIMGIDLKRGAFTYQPLSAEDIKLIGLVCNKLTNNEIADRLHKSEKLIEKRLKLLTERLGIPNNKLSIFEFAVENGYRMV